MNTTTRSVSNPQELAAAIADGVLDIVVDGTISGSPSVTLPEGATLRGGTLAFTGKGVRLSKDNTLKDLTVTTLDDEVAVYNDPYLEDAGTLRLEGLTTVGQVYITAEAGMRHIRVEADGVHVKEANVRGRSEQPHGYGVDVLQGAFTLWNRNPDTSSEFTATLKGIAVGTKETPVRGSGIFVAGYADREGKPAGGAFTADLLETGEVHSDGGIAPGTPDKITGGVFVLGNADVQRVENNGPVTTYGPNDMVLDLWGHTTEWVANAPVVSHGPSGIGFVNFGDMGRLEINAPVITHGVGARGFNVYDGTLESAEFDSIATHGDGAIGVQVSKPVGRIRVRGDVSTTGGEGTSLVKGVQMTLKAMAISLQSGADVQSLQVDGAASTEGEGLVTFEVREGATVRELAVGAVEARGAGGQRTDVNGSVPEGTLS